MTPARFAILLTALKDGAPMKQALAVAGLTVKDRIAMRANVEREKKIQHAQQVGRQRELERKRRLMK